MTDIMQNVIKNGSGRRAKVPNIEVAGKTGTSNKSIDAWFCGYTQELQVIIWYGNDNYKPMKKIEGGGITAAPVFASFLKEYINNFPTTKTRFIVPKKVYYKIYNGNDEAYIKKSQTF